MFSNITDCQMTSLPTEGPSSPPNSPPASSNCATSKATNPQHSTLNPTDKQNESTKSWSNTSEPFATTNKITGWTYHRWRSSLTTMQNMHRHKYPHSWPTTDDTHDTLYASQKPQRTLRPNTS